jgi:protein TonB
MKTLKSIFLLVIPLAVLTGIVIKGQEKELDKYPAPIGGIEAIMKKVVYPEKAKEEKLQGKVLVKAVIDEKGNVENASIEKGVSQLLDDAAVKAIKEVKFTPGEKNGKKVKAEVIIPVKFKLS